MKIIRNLNGCIGAATVMVLSQFRPAAVYSPPQVNQLTLVIIILIISCAIFVGISLLEKHKSNVRILNFIQIALTLVFVVQLRELIGWCLGVEVGYFKLAVVFAIIISLWYLVRPQPIYVIKFLCGIGTCFFILMVLNVLYDFPKLKPNDISTNNNNHVKEHYIAIVFDELDPFFFEVQNDLQSPIPNLRNYYLGSMRYTNAVSAANNTFESLPSILYGNPIKSVDISRKEAKWIDLNFTRQIDFADVIQSSLISKYSAIEHKTAVIGWYHPYCRSILDSDIFCAQVDQTNDIYEGLIYLFDSSIICRKLSLCIAPERSHHVGRAEKAFQEFKVAFGNHELIFIHFPLPHMPCINNGDDSNGCTYIDNLKVADSYFKKIVDYAAQNCKGCRLNIAVTSDHPNRTFLYQTQQRENTTKLLQDAGYSLFARALNERPINYLEVPEFFWGHDFKSIICANPTINTNFIDILINHSKIGGCVYDKI